jgi:ATP-dependent Clp protease ATP-binding subunit ClpC
MWHRFNEQAQRVIYRAEEEAVAVYSDVVDTDHLLLGLLREEESVGSLILKEFNISLANVRARIEKRRAPATADIYTKPSGVTPDAYRALERTAQESQRLSHEYIGTDHLLLALVSRSEYHSARILRELGVTPDVVRKALNAGYEQRQLPKPPIPMP